MKKCIKTFGMNLNFMNFAALECAVFIKYKKMLKSVCSEKV